MISHPEEYADAVRGAAGVLNAAAVVELEGLVIDDLAEYLPLTQRKGGVHSRQWGQVRDRLRANPDAPLAKAPSTPFMVALARTIFSDTEADPAELLDIRSRAELDARLLAGFVPAVYSDLPAAHRWLTFLADHLRQSDTHDLAWRGFA